MNYPDLIFKIITFFFNDLYHFILLVILIYIIKGYRLQFGRPSIFTKIAKKYRDIITRATAKPEAPEVLKRFAKHPAAHPEGGDSWAKP